MDPDSDMGPLVTAEHHQRVTGYLDEGLASGARLAVDGRGVEVRNGRRGYFLGPCLFDDVRPHMSIYRDEIFGPVLSVVRVSGYDVRWS